MKYQAWLPAHGERVDDAEAFEASDVQTAAHDAAEKWHRTRDGWEWSWPVIIRVCAEDGETCDVSVDRDFDPVFTVGKPKRVEAAR